MSAPVGTPKHIASIPIVSRRTTYYELARSLCFNVFFFICMLLLHSLQILAVPLLLSKRSHLNKLFWSSSESAKSCFGLLLVLITRVFGPTELVLTADEGVSLEKLLKRGPNGDILYLDLPRRNVIMANHQIYADWLYIWCFSYLARLHGSIVIILKASLKWAPIVGPAMQGFRFIFLARSWTADKPSLSRHLYNLGAEASEHRPDIGSSRKPLSLLIFPEGTLVSPDTRPISAKFAKKTGVKDMKHTLLPRSTGLLFCLRSLRKRVPDLALVDLTIGYPSIPIDGYGQSHYTLQSIYGFGHSPEKVHIHIRLFDQTAVPVGNITPAPLSTSTRPSAPELSADADSSPEDAAIFDRWLKERWMEKDELLAQFYKTGEFPSGKGERVEVRVGFLEWNDGFKLFAALTAGYLGWAFIWTVIKVPFWLMW